MSLDSVLVDRFNLGTLLTSKRGMSRSINLINDWLVRDSERIDIRVVHLRNLIGHFDEFDIVLPHMDEKLVVRKKCRLLRN